MTPQEALEIIETAIAEVEWEYPMDYAVAFETAIKALEKQIPKKPLKAYGGAYRCPSCQMKYYDHKYWFGTKCCVYCGQALNWDGEE